MKHKTDFEETFLYVTMAIICGLFIVAILCGDGDKGLMHLF